jgi:hypothetical protein
MPTRQKLMEIMSARNDVVVSDPTQRPGTVDVLQGVHVLRLEYDFSKQGGAIGNYPLLAKDDADRVLPKGALTIANILIQNTPLASSGEAVVSLGVNTASDLLNGEDFDDLPGIDASVTASQDRIPSLTVGTAALTGGKLTLLIVYVMAE